VRPRPGLAIELVVLALVIVATGCGRRTERASFDAEPLPAPSTAEVMKALAPSALRVRWGEVAAPRRVGAGTAIPLTVSFTNEGDASWPDNLTASPLQPDGRYAVRLSYSWRPSDGGQAQRSADRANLPHAVAPGQTVSLPIVVRAPEAAGAYELQIELLQELYFWFADHGAPTLTLPVEVTPAASARP
jgi:hypothetical protein